MHYPEITPEELKDFEASLSNKLRVPDNARVRTFKRKNKGVEVTAKKWRETAVIDSIVAAEVATEGWGNHDLYKVAFTITATKGSGLNVGRKTFLNARYSAAAIAAAKEGDWRAFQSTRAMLLLTQIIRARGFDLAGGLSSAKMAAYFPESGESPLVGTELEIEVQDSSDSDFDEITGIFPLKREAADAEV